MATKKVTTKTKAATARKATARARFEAAYDKATPSQRRAIEAATVMLVEGAPYELTKIVALKLADMWQSDDSAEVGNAAR